jgi:hypothetical protein
MARAADRQSDETGAGLIFTAVADHQTSGCCV